MFPNTLLLNITFRCFLPMYKCYFYMFVQIICGNFETMLLEDGLRDDAPAHSGARRCIHPSYYYHVKYLFYFHILVPDKYCEWTMSYSEQL